ncbi:hypothetical protein SCUP234_08063 [Seiridium cupressi]
MRRAPSTPELIRNQESEANHRDKSPRRLNFINGTGLSSASFGKLRVFGVLGRPTSTFHGIISHRRPSLCHFLKFGVIAGAWEASLFAGAS